MKQDGIISQISASAMDESWTDSIVTDGKPVLIIIEGSHAKFTWGVKNGKAFAAMLPDFKFSKEHSLVEGMEVIAPVYKVIGKIPTIRNLSNRIVVLAGEEKSK